MPSLYQIEQEIMECIDLESGEVIDSARLDALQMEREKKLESVALWIKNLKSDVEAYMAEMENFAARKKAAERKIESLNDYLANALGGNKFTTAKCAVNFRRSEGVKFDNEDTFRTWCVQNNRADLLTIQAPKISRTAVKASLKDGDELPGAVLEERLNINIK